MVVNVKVDAARVYERTGRVVERAETDFICGANVIWRRARE